MGTFKLGKMKTGSTVPSFLSQFTVIFKNGLKERENEGGVCVVAKHLSSLPERVVEG